MTGSIRLRLLVAALLFISLGLGLTALTATQLFSNYVAERYVSEMDTVVDAIANGLEHDGTGWQVTVLPTDPRFDLPAGGRYWQIDDGSDEALRSRSLWDAVIERDTAHAINGSIMHTDGPAGSGIEYIERELEIETAAGLQKVSVLAGYESAERHNAVLEFRGGIIAMVLFSAGLLMVAAILQVWVGLRPLGGLTDSVSRIRAGKDKRLADDVPLEVRPLVEEINELLATQEGAIDRARARASDLAHGIKTPLTIIAQAAGSPDAGAKSALILDQVDTIRRRTDRQLQQARLGIGQFVATDLKGICEKLVRVIATLPDSNHINWTTNIPEGTQLNADPADIAEALGNVLDNARKWAGKAVTVASRQDGSNLVIDIDDDGPGIAASDRDAALARGPGVVREGSETGLGLAIANDILRAYGGRVELGESPLGGLRVRFVWPSKSTPVPGEAGPA